MSIYARYEMEMTKSWQKFGDGNDSVGWQKVDDVYNVTACLFVCSEKEGCRDSARLLSNSESAGQALFRRAKKGTRGLMYQDKGSNILQADKISQPDFVIFGGNFLSVYNSSILNKKKI